MKIETIITLIASFGALIFSFLNYRRGTHFENANHLYKLKIDVYSRILAELSKLIDLLSDHMNNAKLHIKYPKDVSPEVLEKSSNEVDQICYRFDEFITSNSLIIPENVLLRVSRFSNYLLGIDVDDENDIIDENLVKKIDKAIDAIIEKGNEINELMREDLHIEKLNAVLYKRLN